MLPMKKILREFHSTPICFVLGVPVQAYAKPHKTRNQGNNGNRPIQVLLDGS